MHVLVESAVLRDDVTNLPTRFATNLTLPVSEMGFNQLSVSGSAVKSAHVLFTTVSEQDLLHNLQETLVVQPLTYSADTQQVKGNKRKATSI